MLQIEGTMKLSTKQISLTELKAMHAKEQAADLFSSFYGAVKFKTWLSFKNACDDNYLQVKIGTKTYYFIGENIGRYAMPIFKNEIKLNNLKDIKELLEL